MFWLSKLATFFSISQTAVWLFIGLTQFSLPLSVLIDSLKLTHVFQFSCVKQNELSEMYVLRNILFKMSSLAPPAMMDIGFFIAADLKKMSLHDASNYKEFMLRTSRENYMNSGE